MQKPFLFFCVFLLLINLCSCDQPQEKQQLKLYVLDGGRINVLNALPFAETDVYSGKSFVFSNPIFLIEHPEGRLIWDLGLPEAISDMPEGLYSPDSIFHMTLEKKLPEQLKGLGLTPDSIAYIAFSHCHFDHTGSANYFKNAENRY